MFFKLRQQRDVFFSWMSGALGQGAGTFPSENL